MDGYWMRWMREMNEDQYLVQKPIEQNSAGECRTGDKIIKVRLKVLKCTRIHKCVRMCMSAI